jgi:hypothetical protein
MDTNSTSRTYRITADVLVSSLAWTGLLIGLLILLLILVPQLGLYIEQLGK